MLSGLSALGQRAVPISLGVAGGLSLAGTGLAFLYFSKSKERAENPLLLPPSPPCAYPELAVVHVNPQEFGKLQIKRITASSGLLSLPTDILRLIFNALPLGARAALPFVSRSIYAVINAQPELRMPVSYEAINYAANQGQLSFIKWLLANGCSFSKDVIAQAAKGGHLEVLQWLRANGSFEGYPILTYDQAAAGGISTYFSG